MPTTSPATHYNYFRDYYPATGRYVESDPIGLSGGINSYAYTRNPLSEIDIEGLQAVRPPPRLPDRANQHNRWNDPNSRLRREYAYGYPTIPTGPYVRDPQPLCWTECPDPADPCKKPETPRLGFPDPLRPGRRKICDGGPSMSASLPANRPLDSPRNQPPRPASESDWGRLIRILRGK